MQLLSSGHTTSYAFNNYFEICDIVIFHLTDDDALHFGIYENKNYIDGTNGQNVRRDSQMQIVYIIIVDSDSFNMWGL